MYVGIFYTCSYMEIYLEGQYICTVANVKHVKMIIFGGLHASYAMIFNKDFC